MRHTRKLEVNAPTGKEKGWEVSHYIAEDSIQLKLNRTSVLVKTLLQSVSFPLGLLPPPPPHELRPLILLLGMLQPSTVSPPPRLDGLLFSICCGPSQDPPLTKVSVKPGCSIPVVSYSDPKDQNSASITED